MNYSLIFDQKTGFFRSRVMVESLSTFHVGGYDNEIHEQTELPDHCWGQKTLLDLYKPTADMFPGDEDNGEMSAWYVLSSIGLYALSPGSDAYTFGAPLFERVEIDISSLSGNGELLPGGANGISYSALKKGGVLEFEMSDVLSQ
eukprot:gene23380-31720_t